ncbi:MAG: bifunctional 3-(3-hydroxy-phenyl)propionate/3-hydroxycinnamic acid hydroxylase [Conexibacter sp.]|nr:bifunctional 3-(3-hydroxy-phenyl)propionate/3-hydroxycinnamic acid hydroxylase [Conexibacter sp.]
MTGPELDTEVAIVGLGPTGAALAAYLGSFGTDVLAFERQPDVTPLPRARMVDGEIMRIFQAFGIAEHLEERFRPAPEFRYWSAAGELLMTLGFEGPRPHHWRSTYMIHQPDVEQAMRGVVEAQPTVGVRRGHEVEAVAEHGDHALLTVRDCATGERTQVRSRYVVGCEGGRSLVRRAIGARHEVLGDDYDWLFIDVDLRRAAELPEHNFYILDPARPMAYLRNPRGYRRFYFRLLPGEDGASMVGEPQVWDLLAPWIGPDDAEIVLSTVFQFHALLADTWRRGPLLIAGDAAHQMPPTMGQGLCSGMRDAGNLAWKLAAVLAGTMDEELLDSYQAERSPHARHYVAGSAMLAQWWSILEPGAATERDDMLRDLTYEPQVPRLGPALHPASETAAGTLLPQDETAAGPLLDDVVGLRFAIVDPAGLLAAAGPEVAEQAARLGAVCVTDPGPVVRRWLADHDARAVVIRPDRYVLGVAATAEELAAVLARVPACARVEHEASWS